MIKEPLPLSHRLKRIKNKKKDIECRWIKEPWHMSVTELDRQGEIQGNVTI